jgi:integrase
MSVASCPTVAGPEAVRQVLDHDIIPALSTRKLAHLTAPMVATVVEGVVNRGAATHAGKLLTTLKQMFRFAEARGYIDRSPAYALDRRDLGVTDPVRDRYLSADEIRAVWAAIDNAPRLSVTVGVALKVLLLTGVRTGEVLKAQWEHLDPDAGLWTIPRENTKTDEGWVVPLAPMVADLFETLRHLRPDSPRVFAGTGDGPLGLSSLGQAARRLRAQMEIPEWRVHDFRRTVRTHLSDMGVTWHICELCLNHSLGRIEKTYARSDLLDQRRDALEKYADWVDLVVNPRDNVRVS